MLFIGGLSRLDRPDGASAKPNARRTRIVRAQLHREDRISHHFGSRGATKGLRIHSFHRADSFQRPVPIPAILDCDTGHDDAMAILLAAGTLDLRGVTTVHGNASVDNTTLNTCKVLELAGLVHVPVAVDPERFWERFIEVLATYP